MVSHRHRSVKLLFEKGTKKVRFHGGSLPCDARFIFISSWAIVALRSRMTTHLTWLALWFMASNPYVSVFMRLFRGFSCDIKRPKGMFPGCAKVRATESKLPGTQVKAGLSRM